MRTGKEKATVQNRGKPWAGNSARTGANNILLLAGTRRKKNATKKVLGNFVLIWRISLCLCPKQASFCRAGIFCFSSTISCYYTQAHPIISMSPKIRLKTEDLESRLSRGAVLRVTLWKPYISGELTLLLTSLQLSGKAVPTLSWLLRVPGEGCRVAGLSPSAAVGLEWGSSGAKRTSSSVEGSDCIGAFEGEGSSSPLWAGYTGVAGMKGSVMELKRWHCPWIWGMYLILHHTGNSAAEAEELACRFVFSCTSILWNYGIIHRIPHWFGLGVTFKPIQTHLPLNQWHLPLNQIAPHPVQPSPERFHGFNFRNAVCQSWSRSPHKGIKKS